MKRCHVQPRTHLPAVMVAAAMLVVYVSGLPTLLHFSVQHGGPVHASSHVDEHAPPSSPLQEHANQCGVWDFIAHGVTDVPPVSTVALRCGVTGAVTIAAQGDVHVQGLDASLARGPPRG